MKSRSLARSGTFLTMQFQKVVLTRAFFHVHRAHSRVLARLFFPHRAHSRVLARFGRAPGAPGRPRRNSDDSCSRARSGAIFRPPGCPKEGRN